MIGRTLRLDVVDLEGGRCVGTIHDPRVRTSQVGLLWVNFGYVPRDGHGGLAARASDELACRGVPCFRYDLPGLGDAPGPLPVTTQQFFPVVTDGRLTAVTSQLVRLLCEREHLDGIVIGGLCGGAVNAIFTADAERDRVKGLVLLEPEMYVTETAQPPDHRGAQTSKGGRGRLRRLVERLERLPFADRLPRPKVFSYWGWMRLLTLESKYGRWVPLPRKALLDYMVSRASLPPVTNVPLALAWQRWVAEKRPALVITASGKLREIFFDRINGSVLAGLVRERYEHVRLTGTNHIFTTGGAITTVVGHLERNWPLFA